MPGQSLGHTDTQSPSCTLGGMEALGKGQTGSSSEPPVCDHSGKEGSGHSVHQGSQGGLGGPWVRDKGEWVPGISADTQAEGQAALCIFAGPWSTLDALEEGVLEARAGVRRAEQNVYCF